MLKLAMDNNKPKFSILLFIVYTTQLTQCKVAYRRNDEDGTNAGTNLIAPGGGDKSGTCWISLQEKTFFQKIDTLEDKYKDVRTEYARKVNTGHMDNRMLDALKQTRGVAERTLQKFRGNPNVIPAGLNLGNYCMMRMPGSILFFYRFKLRNDTRFTVNFIHNNVNDLTLTMRLSLNDLHLLGQYERAVTSSEDPSRLYYRPNKGEVEFLLKDVKYKVEGRYRLLDDRLHIEHIISEIPPMEILMRYTADAPGNSVPLDPEGLRDYLDRMQSDLDLWLKDYFNDFLMLYGFEEGQKNAKIQEYEDQRTMVQNEYADKVMVILNERMRSLGSNLIMPNFMLTAVNGMEIKLYDGTVRGLDSMYRRSVATGKHVDKVRYFLDADIGFSGLKAEYRYDTYVRTGMPPVSGVFVLNADDVSSHMALQIVNYKPATADLQITYQRHGKPETLTVEGPANRIIANFKHLLEHHIISIMSTTLIHHIRSLSSLTRCDPKLATKDGINGEQRNENSVPPNSDDNSEYDMTTPIKPNDYDTTGPPQYTDDNEKTETTNNSDSEDGHTEPSQYTDDDSTYKPSDDDETTKLPDDGEPTDPPPYTEDDDSTGTNDRPNTPPDNSDDNEPTDPPPYTEGDDSTSTNDGPNTPPDNSDDDGSTVTPTTDDDDVPTAPVDNTDEQTASPENGDDNDPTDPPPYTESDGTPNYDDHQSRTTDNVDGIKPDYGFARKESIELELPPKPGSAKGESFKIDHNENFTMIKLNHKIVSDELEPTK